VAVEGTPSPKQPVQIAKQIVQALIGTIPPAKSLDPLAQLVASM
jgi:hypothetical protein